MHAAKSDGSVDSTIVPAIAASLPERRGNDQHRAYDHWVPRDANTAKALGPDIPASILAGTRGDRVKSKSSGEGPLLALPRLS
jgi:hypothetical protein